MLVTILGSPVTGETQHVYGTIEATDTGFVGSTEELSGMAASYRKFLAIRNNDVEVRGGVPVITKWPSPKETLQHMLARPELAGRIYEGAPNQSAQPVYDE